MCPPSQRQVFAFILLASLASMASALYLQYAVHLHPCPLCIFQRVAMMTVGLIALIATLHDGGRFSRRAYALLLALAALAGAGVATRHIWLQHLPADQVPDCGPGLNYMLQVFPMQKVLSLVLRGSGECAKVDWTLLGLSLPELSFAAFFSIFLLAVWQMLRR